MIGPLPSGFPPGVGIHVIRDGGIFDGRFYLTPTGPALTLALDTPQAREVSRRIAWFDYWENVQ